MLPDYQLVIVSAAHYNSIIYKGPDRDKPIYLYLNNQHYDLIISMPALLGKKLLLFTLRERIQHGG